MQLPLRIAVPMIISAYNGMALTPARPPSIFATGRVSPLPSGGEGVGVGGHGDHGKEALPWWFFGLLGGLVSVWLLTPTLGAWLGLPSGEEGEEAGPGGLMTTLLTWRSYIVLFLPGALAGGALGWFIIGP